MSYEQSTYTDILARALARVPDSFDKREGSIIFDAVAPACYEIAEMYLELSRLMDRTFADTAVGEDLDRRAEERGTSRQAATYATRKGTFNKAISIGERFRIEDTSYAVTSLISGFDYVLTCEDTGTIGNLYFGTLTPISYIDNLTTALLTDILIPGSDEETDEEYRARYFDKLSSESFGGNQADYKERTKELPGIGGTKVYPTWAGAGTVRLSVIDSNYDVPSPTVITETQTAVDPEVNAGEGLGFAPIGHIVTVSPVVAVVINVAATFTLDTGYVWADVEPIIIPTLESYLLQLRQGWDALPITNGLVVRISQIESALLQITGIVDIGGTTINTVAANLILQPDQIPTLGTVTEI